LRMRFVMEGPIGASAWHGCGVTGGRAIASQRVWRRFATQQYQNELENPSTLFAQ
jgi:hypothetical protein